MNKDLNTAQTADIAAAVKTIKEAILQSRYQAARLANAEMLKLYFAIGGYVSANSRAGTWGTGAIDAISERLSKELPGLRGFSATNMKNMRLFFEEWTLHRNRQPVAGEIGHPPAGKVTCGRNKKAIEFRQSVADDLGPNDSNAFMSIGFTHHMAILFACKTVDERLFYIRKCASEFWSKRILLQHLKANDYAAQGKAVNNFELTMPDERQVSRAVQAFKDEYLLDFVNIVDANDDEETLDEPEWMMEMVAKIRHFIQALGPDFCFMDVKKRFVVEGDELFADLVFFHRALKCMVAVELKRGKFKAAYLGQLELYLACLDQYVKREDENPSVGLLLCREMNRTMVGLTIRRHNSPMGVATYRTAEDVPDDYKSLRPLLDGAQHILDEGELEPTSSRKEPQ